VVYGGHVISVAHALAFNGLENAIRVLAFNGGTITTAGNLVFSGTSNGWFRAHDAETGEQLWEFEVGAGPASPVTYEIDGVQYVSILAGRGGNTPPGRVWTFVLDGQAPRLLRSPCWAAPILSLSP
jgi:outer membrane protein assembly factor BamB